MTRGAGESGEKCGGHRLLPLLFGSPSTVKLAGMTVHYPGDEPPPVRQCLKVQGSPARSVAHPSCCHCFLDHRARQIELPRMEDHCQQGTRHTFCESQPGETRSMSPWGPLCMQPLGLQMEYMEARLSGPRWKTVGNRLPMAYSMIASLSR